MLHRLPLTLIALALGTTHCGDDAATTADAATSADTATTADAATSADTAVPADSAAGDASTETTVPDSVATDTAGPEVEPRPVDEVFRVIAVTRGIPSPYALAPVLAILPDGKRVEGFTDAAGEITITGVDYTLGGLTITSNGEGGHLFGGLVGFGPAEFDPMRDQAGVITVTVGQRDGLEPGGFTISGVAAGMLDTDHNLLVSTDAVGAVPWEHRGDSWHIDGVPPERAFHVLADEWSFGSGVGPNKIDVIIHAWTSVAHEPIAQATIVPIDFGQSLSSTAVSGSFTGPVGDTTSLDEGGVGYVNVVERDTDFATARLGVTTKSKRTAGGGVEFTVEHVEPDWAADPVTIYGVNKGDEASLVLEAGWPSGLGPALPFYVPVTLDAPGLAGQTATEPIQWSGADPAASVVVNLYAGPAGARLLVGRLFVRKGAAEVTLPPFPAGFDPFGAFDTTSLGVQVVTCDPGLTPKAWCKRISNSRIGIITAP